MKQTWQQLPVEPMGHGVGPRESGGQTELLGADQHFPRGGVQRLLLRCAAFLAFLIDLLCHRSISLA
jgi:hypothetical protein